MPSRRTGALLLTLLLLAVLGVGLAYPVWLTIRGGFESVDGGVTLHHVALVFTDPGLRAGLVNALLIAVATTLLSAAIALPLALLNARFDFPGKSILAALVLVPLILPPFVGAIGIGHLFGRYGTVNVILQDLGLIEHGIDFIGRGGFWAIVGVEALHLYPILYLNVVAALANLDPALDEAARNLGAGGWRRLRTVTLPLVAPGLFAGGTIVFIWSFTELGTPLMFDYQLVTPVQIFNGLKEMETSRQPYALTAIMLAIAALSYVIGRRLVGGTHAMYAKASVRAETRRLPTGRGLAAAAFAFGVFALAAVPHLGVIFASLSPVAGWYDSVLPARLTLENYESALSHPLAIGAIRNSLGYAAAATGIDLVLGVVIAYLVVRVRAPGSRLLDALSMLPLAVPGLVMAFGYVAVSLRWPFGEGQPLAGLVDVLGPAPNPVPLLIVAFAVRRLPYVVRSAAAGLSQTSPELEEASLCLGAGRISTIARIVLPLITANLVAGGLLAFAFAMLEVSDSLILAQLAEHFPVTKAIYVLFERLGDGRAIASAMGVWAMALLAVTLVGASLTMGKRMGAIFRV